MKRVFGLSLLLVLVSAVAAFAGDYLVYEFTAEGSDPGVGKMAANILQGEMAARTPLVVRVIPEPGVVDETWAQQRQREQLAEAVVVARIMQIGDSATIQALAVWPNQTIRYDIRLVDIGEFTAVAPRLAEAIIARQSFEKTVSVVTVTHAEKEAHQRVEGDFSWGPGLGVIVPVGGSYGGAGILYDIDLEFRYEIEHLGFAFDTGVYFNDAGNDDAAAYEWPIDFVFYYYLSEGENSTFLGGTFGLHSISGTANLDEEDEEDFAGWVPSVSGFVGYEFLRTHTFHFTARSGFRAALSAPDGYNCYGMFLNLGMTF